MKVFDTGARRSTDAEALAYNLINIQGLEQIRHLKTDEPYMTVGEVVYSIYKYIGCVNLEYLCQAIQGVDSLIDPDPSSARFFLLSVASIERLAVAYKEGAKKYGAHNYLKGFPVSDLLNHALRHLFMSTHDGSEDHLGHALWNLTVAAYFSTHRDKKFLDLKPIGEYYCDTDSPTEN